MPNFSTILNEYLQTVKSDIISEMSAQGRNASRTAVNSLRVVANQYLQAELRGVAYFEYLQDGVGSQPKAVSPEFRENIESWMRYKGITPDNGKSIRSASYGIAKSIVDRGTAIRRGQQGLTITDIIKENIPTALKDISSEMVLEFTDKLTLRNAR